MISRGLLSTKPGRLSAFFLLYVTEGIPLGFTAIAVATQMRRQGVGVAEIGAFVGWLYLPWAFKWAYGPFVDVLSSERLGRRRTWIVLAQVMMILTLLAGLPVDFTAEVKLFTALVAVHNVFAATQDVAIDALAVNTLRADERGLANGLMFAGQNVGQAVGGAGTLFLAPYFGFRATFFFVAACIALVTILVSLRLREPRGPPRPERSGAALPSAANDIRAFVREALGAFFGSRAAFVGLLFALLPAGAFALSLALQSNLAVELGLGDRAIATLAFWSTLVAALGCVAGGWASDRLGRRRMLALFIAATALPTLYLAHAMSRAGWVMPVDVKGAGRAAAPHLLVATFWATTLLHSAFHGLMFGTRTALFMDITTPRVAATQFTAYMALLNLVTSYSAAWQGLALSRWGYPTTLVIDAGVGLLGLSLLPLVSARRPG
jgi:MFS transporter, PAT family, beta-lactamase induction signal transducer AmpG